MIGQTISHFRILAHLGTGGMGSVYKARDLRLDRPVALKFLAPHADPGRQGHERLLREARSAALLDHPNICTIYEVGGGEKGTEIFIAMAYYEGQTLQERLRGVPLELGEAVSIASQLADGLCYAHERGIVHRDLKPANVLLVGSQVKILDFGLAKTTEGEALSASGAVLGTPGYMAPEQVEGRSVDARADVWALGVLLYEMLTGECPFRRSSASASLLAILRDDPPTLTGAKPWLPPLLVDLVERALSKVAEQRLASMREVRSRLARYEDQAATRTLVPAPGEASDPASKGRSIAVLPFVDLSPDRNQGYFCDGICVEIIDSLSGVDDLEVASRTSSFRFRDGATDVREIAAQLRVEALLEGEVRKSGDRLRITCKLVDASQGFQLWSGRFDRQLNDIFEVQEEIARQIVAALEVTLSPEKSEELHRAPTRRADAYDCYLHPRDAFFRGGRHHYQQATELFARAAELDPDFALAHSGQAMGFSWMYLYWDPSRHNLRGAMDASRRAVELDPELAEARASRGLALSLDDRFEAARSELEQAMELNPTLFEAAYLLGRICFSYGRFQEALPLFERAAKLQPEELQTPTLLAKTYRALGREAEALAAHRRALALAEHRLHHDPSDVRAVCGGACALVELGATERGLRWAARVAGLDDTMIYYAVCAFARAGETEQALAALEQAVATGFAHRRWMEADPDLDELRREPRFRAILDRVHPQGLSDSRSSPPPH